jgi:hypothetical protein
LVWIDDDFVWDEQHGFDAAPRQPPAIWAGPVDYARGEMHVRLRVRDKADDTPIWLEVCLWQEKLGGPHVCLNCLTPPWADKAERTCSLSPAARNPRFDFSKPWVATQIRIKDGSAGRGKDLAKLGKGLPIKARYSVVLVPAGQTFPGWEKVAGPGPLATAKR